MIENFMSKASWETLMEHARIGRSKHPSYVEEIELQKQELKKASDDFVEGMLLGIVSLSTGVNMRTGVDIFGISVASMGALAYILDERGFKFPENEKPKFASEPSQAEIDAEVEKMLKKMDEEGKG